MLTHMFTMSCVDPNFHLISFSSCLEDFIISYNAGILLINSFMFYMSEKINYTQIFTFLQRLFTLHRMQGNIFLFLKKYYLFIYLFGCVGS